MPRALLGRSDALRVLSTYEIFMDRVLSGELACSVLLGYPFNERCTNNIMCVEGIREERQVEYSILVPLQPSLRFSFSQYETRLQITSAPAPWLLLQFLSCLLARIRIARPFLSSYCVKEKTKKTLVHTPNAVGFTPLHDFMPIYCYNRCAYSKNSLVEVCAFREASTPKIINRNDPLIWSKLPLSCANNAQDKELRHWPSLHHMAAFTPECKWETKHLR